MELWDDSTERERDRAIDEFIELVVALDGILKSQAAGDARIVGALAALR